MNTFYKLTKSLICMVFIFGLPWCINAKNNPYRHFETLDQDGKYQLEWLVDWKESRVIFNVTVKTKGYVGFGLSRKGKMSGADIVIGGVLPSGQPYFNDRHAIGNQLPVEDPSQDWELHSALENDTHTFLSFSRPLETCDEDHDLPIHGDVIGMIWAYGERDDDFEYHHQNRGVFYAYLLDPDLTPRELKETNQYGFGGHQDTFGSLKIWTITKTDVVPDKDTSYICRIFQAPGTQEKHHAVGFRSIIPTATEQRHVHHYMLHRCIPPVDQDASSIFQPLLGYQETCYIIRERAGRIPTDYCTEVFHVWAVGQKPNFFPEHVGIPFSAGEYFMLQVHYDNPDLIPGVQVSHSLEIFYTDEIREHDAAPLFYGHLAPGSSSIMIPPNSLSHEIHGHCGSGCTRSMLPSTGIKVFAAFLHSHRAGRGIRVIHIRDNKELPWISYDNNYNFDYQQIRLMREERLILPGDILVKRCIFDNTDTDGNATIGGFSTSQEMCQGMLWYYDKIPDRNWCHSEIRAEEYGNFLRINNATWSDSRVENIVTSPSQNAGLLVSEVASYKTDWTIKKRKQLQHYQLHLPQITECPSEINDAEELESDGNYDAWLEGGLINSPRPPLLPQRWMLPSTFKNSVKWTRSPTLNRERSIKARGIKSQETETQFESVYGKDIVRYELPNLCGTSH